MTAIIEIEGLSKQFGPLTALNDLSLTVEEGAVFGFVGPNGAGKTTTMRILTTLLTPTAGRARIAGHSVTGDPRAVRRAIGYMPDFFGVYDDMKVWEYLDFFAACYDVPAASRQGLVADLLALVDLEHKSDVFVHTLSRGMKQRLCLARTLTHDPQVLILDEPASGLDPRARIEIRELLRELQALGKTIFFSSHILSEVADVCTTIGIIESGNLVAQGDMEEMRKKLRANRLLHIRTLDDVQELAQLLRQQAQVENVAVLESAGPSASELQVGYTGDDEQLSALLHTLVKHGVRLTSFSEESGDLEEVFMQVTRGVVS